MDPKTRFSIKPYGTWAIKKTDVTPLECYGCDKVIGWTREFDLNGSYFFCESCRELLD